MGESNRSTIPQPPTQFVLPPLGGQWFRWADINCCFWPGRSGRASRVNAALAEIRYLGGVYLLAWSSPGPPPTARPAERAVKYVGETSEFLRRMNQFRTSAGFIGPPSDGHSAGWRWPVGESEHLWIAFFDVGNGLLPHLAEGLRHWMEAVALEEYRVAHGSLPPVNIAKNGVVTFAPFA